MIFSIPSDKSNIHNSHVANNSKKMLGPSGWSDAGEQWHRSGHPAVGSAAGGRRRGGVPRQGHGEGRQIESPFLMYGHLLSSPFRHPGG